MKNDSCLSNLLIAQVTIVPRRYCQSPGAASPIVGHTPKKNISAIEFQAGKKKTSREICVAWTQQTLDIEKGFIAPDFLFLQKKGCTLEILLMEEIRLTSGYGKYLIIYKASYMLGGAGFLPSTVACMFSQLITPHAKFKVRDICCMMDPGFMIQHETPMI